MPSNREFGFQILIAGQRVPEYEKDGECYVECNLNTPYSYKEKVVENIGGETETQEYPVTPYQIKIMTYQAGQSYYRVLVDGVKVKGLALENVESTVIKGFRDGHFVREFLFSLPRFARNENDRLNTQRIPNIGKVTIEAWLATHRTTERCMRRKNLSFEQANKKDSSAVTNGTYVMATSRAGKVVCGRSVMRNVDSWKLVSLRSTLAVKYHMAHTLQEMGFTLKAMTFPRVMQGASHSGSRRSAARPPIKEEDRVGEPSQKRKKTSHLRDTSASRNMQMLRDAADSLLALRHKSSTHVRVPSFVQESEEISVVGVRNPVVKNKPPTGNRKSPVVIDLTEDDDAMDADITVLPDVKVEAKELEPPTSTQSSTTLKDKVKSTNDITEVVASPPPAGVDKDVAPVAHKEADPVAPEKAGPVARGETDPVVCGETAPVARGESDPVAPEEADPVVPKEADPVVPEEVDPVAHEETAKEATSRVHEVPDPVAPEEADPALHEKPALVINKEAPVVPEEAATVVGEEVRPVVDEEAAPVVHEEAAAVDETVGSVVTQAATLATDLTVTKLRTGEDVFQNLDKKEEVDSLLTDSAFESMGSPSDVSKSVSMETTDHVADRDSLLDGSSGST